jgi:hypothetical protein
MVDTLEFARAVLAQKDDQLAEDCDWQPLSVEGGATGLRLVHRSTRLEIEVEPRRTEAQTRFIALLLLRNRCYDLLRWAGRPKKAR